jgi:hypothetical protein
MSHLRKEYECLIYPGMPQPELNVETKEEKNIALKVMIAGLTPEQLVFVADLVNKRLSQVNTLGTDKK